MSEQSQPLPAARAAVDAVLRRIVADPRVAYYFDPITDCFEKLCAAQAHFLGTDTQSVRAMLEPRMRFEAPPDTSDLLDALRRIARMAETGEPGIRAVALKAIADATGGAV